MGIYVFNRFASVLWDVYMRYMYCHLTHIYICCTVFLFVFNRFASERSTIYIHSLSADYYIHTLASRSRVFSLRIYILYIFLSSFSRSLFLPLSFSHTHMYTHGSACTHACNVLDWYVAAEKKKKRYLHATGFGFHQNHWSKRLIDRHRRRRKRRRRHGCRRNSGR